MTAAEGRHGGADILRGLRELSSLNEDDAAKMADIVERDRAEKWERHDLR